MKKVIGILGGMGPAATTDLMRKVIDMTEADRDQDHIHILVDSNTRIPDRTAAILHDGEDPVPEMLASAKRLESMGADFLIMPCNTAHYFIHALEEGVDIPFINMPVETAHLLKARGIEIAAVLATDGTVQSGLYEKALSRENISVIYPDEDQQKTIMSLIYDYIKKGIMEPEKLPCEEMIAIKHDLLERGAQALILACTELPVAFEKMNLLDADCVDPTSVLAGEAIRKAGAKVRPSYHY